MSLLFEKETTQEYSFKNNNDLFNSFSNNNCNYLWSEINKTSQKENSISNNLIINNVKLNIPEPKSILDSKFYILKKIGQGSSAKVYLGVLIESLLDNNNPNQLKYFSIKIMDPDKTDLNIFKTEVKLLEKINHENVLKIFAYGFGKKESYNKNKNKFPKEVYYIVMEHLEHDELLKYITNAKPGENIGFGEEFGRLIFAQLLDGLEAMHNLNIYHRDIKPNNIMLGEDSYKLKYVDFGLGTDEIGKLNSFLGTPNYAAPELLLKRPYFGKSEDIFSLGVTLFVLVTGCLPFKLATPNDSLYQYFIKCDYVEYWKKRMIDVSPSFMELFDNMVAFDYSQRPSISEIRESSWMKEINWDLMPYLKQEFILREEKIKFNEKKSQAQDIKKEINNKNEPLLSLLETKKQVRNNGLINNNNKFKNNYDENDNSNIINNNIKTKMKQNKGLIKIKSKTKNIHNLLLKIQRLLKRKGYIPIKQNLNGLELEITDGEIDILLKIKSLKQGYAKIKYYKINGSSENFELFKKKIKFLKTKDC